MESKEDVTQPQQKARYVWDPKTLAWVESTETLTREAQVEPATEVSAEPVPVAAISEERAAAQGVAAEPAAEAVEFEYQGIWIRLGAAIIDLIVLTIVGVIIHYAIGHNVVIPSYVVLAYGLLYFGGFWWWRGQTPGKMLIGARVIRRDGRPIGVERAFLRYLFYLLPIYGPIVFFATTVSSWFIFVLPILAIIAMAFSRQKRGIHDLIAGTCVINTRVRMPQTEEFEAAATDQEDESGPGTSG